MGNERASYGEQHGVGKQTLTSSAEFEMCVPPGKTTLVEAEAEVSSVESDLARVARRVGERVVDKGKFEYVVQADGSFEIAKAPPPFAHSKGRRITIGELPSVWGVLHDLLLAQPSQNAAPSSTPVTSEAAKPAQAPKAGLSREAMEENDKRVKSKAAQVEG